MCDEPSPQSAGQRAGPVATACAARALRSCSPSSAAAVVLVFRSRTRRRWSPRRPRVTGIVWRHATLRKCTSTRCGSVWPNYRGGAQPERLRDRLQRAMCWEPRLRVHHFERPGRLRSRSCGRWRGHPAAAGSLLRVALAAHRGCLREAILQCITWGWSGLRGERPRKSLCAQPTATAPRPPQSSAGTATVPCSCPTTASPGARPARGSIRR